MNHQIAVWEEFVGGRKEVDPVSRDPFAREPNSQVALTLSELQVLGVGVASDRCPIDEVWRNRPECQAVPALCHVLIRNDSMLPLLLRKPREYCETISGEWQVDWVGQGTGKLHCPGGPKRQGVD